MKKLFGGILMALIGVAPVPYRIVQSSAIEAGGPLALFPAPAGLPLAAAWL